MRGRGRRERNCGFGLIKGFPGGGRNPPRFSGYGSRDEPGGLRVGPTAGAWVRPMGVASRGFARGHPGLRPGSETRRRGIHDPLRTIVERACFRCEGLGVFSGRRSRAGAPRAGRRDPRPGRPDLPAGNESAPEAIGVLRGYLDPGRISPRFRPVFTPRPRIDQARKSASPRWKPRGRPVVPPNYAGASPDGTVPSRSTLLRAQAIRRPRTSRSTGPFRIA